MSDVATFFIFLGRLLAAAWERLSCSHAWLESYEVPFSEPLVRRTCRLCGSVHVVYAEMS